MNQTHSADVPEVADVEVPQALKENIEHLKQLHQRGCTINNNIEQSKVMKVFNIEGHCSNYSKHVYDPDYYVALARETEPETQQPRKDSQTCGQNAKAEAANAAEARGRPSGWSTD
ncbi:HCNGP-like family protein, putative [Babesia bigemina]|uniref:HCNGP-like family protein, putative n=1 Tax=Babesia bigemina TaxID=5866 RepID=A0A061D9V9_BABBI|nr:HCNGP-like family protein, putative [Babesia bigemina]CDR96757.1 HCNGP-like family protein, putative [Babesia bigemina]|eukprot:XP_012768943.1 HCNGP-like family protein, putative [Babesia bigemina]